jgi:hypothetical protein
MLEIMGRWVGLRPAVAMAERGAPARGQGKIKVSGRLSGK